jgi:hypothetical protein
MPNRSGIRYVGRVRESAIASLRAMSVEIEGMPYRIYRGPDDQNPERRATRARRNVELCDLELRETGPQPRLLNCLGEAFQVLQQPHDAAASYQQARAGGFLRPADDRRVPKQ